MVNDGRYPSLLINLPGKFRVRRIVQRSREKILWMKSISILLTLYRIDSDSLTNPSLFHPFQLAHLFSSSRYHYKRKSFLFERKKKKKKKEKNTQSRIQPPSFDPPLPFPVARKPKIARPSSLHSPIFPLVLSPPRGKNYSVDERAGEQGR